MWMCRQESNSHGYVGPVNCEFMFAGAVLDSIFIIWLANAVKCCTGKHKHLTGPMYPCELLSCVHIHMSTCCFMWPGCFLFFCIWQPSARSGFMRLSYTILLELATYCQWPPKPVCIAYRNASCISWNSYILISLPLPDHNFLVGHGFPIRIQFNRKKWSGNVRIPMHVKYINEIIYISHSNFPSHISHTVLVRCNGQFHSIFRGYGKTKT